MLQIALYTSVVSIDMHSGDQMLKFIVTLYCVWVIISNSPVSVKLDLPLARGTSEIYCYSGELNNSNENNI